MSRTSRPRLAFLCAALAVFALSTAAVADDHPKGDVGILGGLVFPDEDVVGHGVDADDSGIGIGGMLNHYLHDNWAIFVDGLYTSLGGQPEQYGDATQLTFRVGPRVFVPTVNDRLSFYGDLSVGYGMYGFDNAEDISRPIISVSAGQRFAATEKLALWSQLRGDRTVGSDDADPIQDAIVTGHFLFGATLTMGGDSGPDPDSDGDGVRDSKDSCPDTPRGAKVDRSGCPLDSDGDGVYDGLDKCPDTPAGMKVDSRGCSDMDGDGVADDKDKCPDTPAGWPVDRNGCALDSDGDGVKDGADKCPDTPRGVEVDADGCPVAEKLFEVDETTGEVKAFILEGVNFEFNSATLTADSRTTLNRVTESLKAYPDVNVEVGGHTDSQGADAYNMKLSQQRANSVRAYLVAQGIAVERMTTKGYGETKPIASNENAEGRALNRRVELTKR